MGSESSSEQKQVQTNRPAFGSMNSLKPKGMPSEEVNNPNDKWAVNLD
jgi:hypothetical protein